MADARMNVVRHRAAQGDTPRVPPTDPIAQWLALLDRMLRLPDDVRSSLVVELESHLRDHVRDLMLEGLDEDRAMRRALADLGDAATLAQALHRTHRPPRRYLMHAALIAIVGTAVGLGTLSLRGTGAPAANDAPTPPVAPIAAGVPSKPPAAPAAPTAPVAATLAKAPSAQGEGHVGTSHSDPAHAMNLLAPTHAAGNALAPAVGSRVYLAQAAPVIEGRVSMSLKENPVRHALEAIAKAANKPYYIHKDLLSEANNDGRVTLELKDASPAFALRALNESLDNCDIDSGSQIEMRLTDGTIEFARREHFDRRERRLSSYDISGAIASGTSGDEIIELLQDLIESDSWAPHGGESAKARVIGNQLIVHAPPRIHAKVVWVLQQVSQTSAGATPAPAPSRPGVAPTNLLTPAVPQMKTPEQTTVCGAAPEPNMSVVSAMNAPLLASENMVGNAAAPAPAAGCAPEKAAAPKHAQPSRELPRPAASPRL